MSQHELTIRASNPTDADNLTGLSTVGARTYVAGARGLVAEVDGTAVAAIALTSGAVAVDFQRARPRVIDALRYRRYQILRQGGDVGGARNTLRRLAPPRPSLHERAA